MERLAPVLQHASERAAREMLSNLVLSHESETDPIEGRVDHDLHVVDDQSMDAVRRKLQCLLAVPTSLRKPATDSMRKNRGKPSS